MKTIIAGSRTIHSTVLLDQAISICPWVITEVVSGHAQGVDRLGEWWAHVNNIPCVRLPAEWDVYGKSAGYRRNVEMANYAEACLVLWDCVSPGSKHMIDIAQKEGLRLLVVGVARYEG